MIIVYVIDNYGELSNGTTITALRSKKHLEKRGHTVRVVTAGPVEGPDIYHLEKRRIPIVSKVAEKQQMYFAKPDKKIMRKAFAGADVVHFFMPWKVSRVGIKICRKMRIPYTAAFHAQPENITYGMGLGRLGKPVAWYIYHKFKLQFYRHVTHVHCPSAFIAYELKNKKYKNRYHIISNGIDHHYKRGEKPNHAYYQILSTGRYALEKRQDVIIRAIGKSRYRNQIKLILAGHGPLEKKYRRLAERYQVDTTFAFYTQKELINKIHESDLYVHAADVEIEGIAALEAIACGLVPIIAESNKSATSQFTIDDRNVFKANNIDELSYKIDYWLNRPKERQAMSVKYEAHANNYRLDHAISLLEQMFHQSIEDHKRAIVAKQKAQRGYRKQFVPSWIKRAFSFIMYYAIALPILTVYLRLIRGVTFKNRKNVKELKGGAIMVSNHVHTLDSVMGAMTIFPKKPLFTSIKSNFKLPVAGRLVNILGSMPVPETPSEMKVFFYELSKQVRKGRIVHFFPEGELIKNDTKLRDFKRGAFMLAEETKSPILPIGISFHEKKSIFPILGKDRIVINVGKPIYPDVFKLKRESIAFLSNESFEVMDDLISIKKA